MNRFLSKQANEEEVEIVHGAMLPFAGALGGAVAGHELVRAIPKAGLLGTLAGSLAGGSIGSYTGSKMQEAMNRQAFSEVREQLEKQAALFSRKKAPDEFDVLKQERDQALNAFRQNAEKLDKLNPQAKADINAAMQTAREKTVPKATPKAEPAAPKRKPIPDFGDYVNEPRVTPKPAASTVSAGSRVASKAKPKLAKGRLGLLAGGTVLAAGGAKMGYDKWKEEKVAFSEMREELEKTAARFN